MKKYNFFYPLLFILVWFAIFPCSGFSYEHDDAYGGISKTNTLGYDYWELDIFCFCIDVTETGKKYDIIYNISISSNSSIDILFFSSQDKYPDGLPSTQGTKLDTVNLSLDYLPTRFMYIDNTNATVRVPSEMLPSASYSGDVEVTVIIHCECKEIKEKDGPLEFLGALFGICFIPAVVTITYLYRRKK
ncbi:MAG: hypothetical protein ACFE94_05775 [Candidatus Hodarchaeota archaeon]